MYLLNYTWIVDFHEKIFYVTYNIWHNIWHNFYINYINILYSVTDIQKLKNPIK